MSRWLLRGNTEQGLANATIWRDHICAAFAVAPNLTAGGGARCLVLLRKVLTQMVAVHCSWHTTPQHATAARMHTMWAVHVPSMAVTRTAWLRP